VGVAGDPRMSVVPVTAPVLLPWYGGKSRIASWVIEHLPAHGVYVEPFGGSMAVLLAKPPSIVEVYNDVDEGLVNFWRVVRDPAMCAELRIRLSLTPYSRAEHAWSRGTWRLVEDDVDRAARWWVSIRQAFGAIQTTTGWSFTKSPGKGISREVSKFLGAIDRTLPAVHERIRGIQIEHADWRKMFDRYDTEDALFYCDPPYVMATRKKRGVYLHEVVDEDHRNLVARLLEIRGAAVVSGYDHPLYAPLASAGWKVRRRRVFCKVTVSRGEDVVRRRRGARRTEVLWIKPSTKAAK
jgi:DNA adenine methylase